MTAEEIIEKWKVDHNYCLDYEGIKALGRDGLRHLIEISLEIPEIRKYYVDFIMAYYDRVLSPPISSGSLLF
jgi:hypothetical protein